MNNIWQWIVTHQELTALYLGLAITLINNITPHFVSAKTRWGAVLLFLAQAFSFLKSKGESGALGSLQLPLFAGELLKWVWNAFNNLGAKALLLLFVVLPLASCATVSKQISSMDAVIAKLSPVAVGAFHARCEGEAQACKAKKVASENCIGWLKCCQERRALQELLDDAQASLSLAMRFAAVSDEAGAGKAIIEAATLIDKVYKAVRDKKLVIP